MNLNYKFLPERKKRRLVIVGVSIMVLFGILVTTSAIWFTLYLSYDERNNGPAANKTQSDIEGEFQRITPLPLAVAVEHISMHKTHQGTVNSAYKTDRSYEDIKAYYDKELANRGWRFVREALLTYDGKDNGGKQLFYCKGNYRADLQSAGRQETEFGWTYSFALSWGLSNECK